jgi:hypothetical protein
VIYKAITLPYQEVAEWKEDRVALLGCLSWRFSMLSSIGFKIVLGLVEGVRVQE